MPPRVMTRSAGRPAAASQGGETGKRVGSEGRRVIVPRRRNVELTGEPEGQGSDQSVEGDPTLSTIIPTIARTSLPAFSHRLEVYDDRRVLSSVMEMQMLEMNYGINAWSGWPCLRYTARFMGVGEVSSSLSDSRKRKIEWFRVWPCSTDLGLGLVKLFATTAKPVGRENTGAWPKCATCNSYHAPGGPCRTCFKCNRPGHLAKDYKGVPRSVNPVNARNLTVRTCYECGSTDHVRSACPILNRAQGPRGNCPNQVVSNNEGQGHRNQKNQARGRAFMLGEEEARQDPNIVTGIELSELGFRYEIEIASEQLVEIDKVIKGCKLEIEGHVFDIDLIPLGHGSFDVIIRMDWLSNHNAEIICHEKVVRIPLPHDKLEYGVLPSSGYGVLDLVFFVVFGECRHRYAASSSMDTAYWFSK
ncbi:putative reverse transcriptase domain-containing protein [Tanacetum coccineum]